MFCQSRVYQKWKLFISGLFPFLQCFCKIKYQWDIKMIKLFDIYEKVFLFN